MRFVDFRTFGVWMNVAILLVAAVLVWAAGTRLAHYADAICLDSLAVLILYPVGLVILYGLR